MSTIPFDTIKVGDSYQKVCHITPDVFEQFLKLSHDRNPLHVDAVLRNSMGLAEKSCMEASC